jgi:thiosulfate/3-mercaptopyruvate sulfurtransferase
VVLIDARDRVFYDGLQPGGRPPTPGHIPGAHSLPFSSVFNDETGFLLPAAELEALFTKAGVKPGATVIGYCHIGQQATAMLFAARSLGHPVKLYDGSFEEWSQRGLPVVNPAKK